MQTTCKIATIAVALFLAVQTGYGQSDGSDDFEVPRIEVVVTNDIIDTFFDVELFFISNFSVQATFYDADMAGAEVGEGDENIIVPDPFDGDRAAMLEFSGFGVLSAFGVQAAATTINYSISFWYYTNTDVIVLALNTDLIGGVTSNFSQLLSTGGEWVFQEIDLFEVFDDIPWSGFQFRNFVNEDKVLFIDEVILTIPTEPNTCNGMVDPYLCPCGPFRVICGSPGPEVLGGTDECDCIYGFGGADTIFGNGGNDYIWGGLGNDNIFGGNGNDVIYGEGGFDTAYGGNGNDLMYGGNQGDILYGGNGNDILFGQLGNDRLYGQANADKMFGGDGADTLYSGLGFDNLQGGNGADILVSEDSQKDTLNGGLLFDKAFLSTMGCGDHKYIAVEKVINNNDKFLTNCI